MAEGKAHKLNVADGVSSEDQVNPHPLFAPKVNTYKVTAETGLFKNGQQYGQGDEVDLPEAEGKAHEAINEVELVKEGEDARASDEENAE